MNLTRTHLYALILTASLIWSAGTVSVRAALTSVSPTDSLTRGLVGYWTFDGPDMISKVKDKSGRGNDAILGGFAQGTSTYVVPGRVGQALNFKGATQNNYASTTVADFNFERTDTFSMSAWIKTDGNFPSGCASSIVGNSKYVGNDIGYFFYVIGPNCWPGASYENTLSLQLWSTGSCAGALIIYSPLGAITPNIWKHVLVTYDGSGDLSGVKMYIDGVSQSLTKYLTCTITVGTMKTNQPMRIGDDYTNDYFSGSLDEVRVYNRVLSATEAKQLYNMGATKYAVSPTVTATSTCSVGLSCGLVGYWTFDGKDTPWTSSSAATTVDRSGNGGTGTLRGMSQSISPALGKVGQALNFRANVGEYVEVADNDRYSFGNGTSDTPFALSAWIYYGGIDAAFTGWPIISKWNNTSPAIAEWGFYVSGTNVVGSGSSGGLTLQINSGGGVANRFVVEGRTSLVAGRWYHVMATYDGSSTSSGIKLYINGIQDTTDVKSDGTYTAMSNLSSTVDIGGMIRSNATFDSFAKGKIDDVRIYNRILSTSEITQLYNTSATKYAVSPTVTATSTCSVGLSCGLTGYWTFDGKDTDWSTNTSNDKSGNGHHAKFISMSTTTSPIRGPVGQAIKAASTTAEYIDYKVTPASLMSNATGTMALWMYTYTPVVGDGCRTNGSTNVTFSDGLTSGGGDVWIGYGTTGICVGIYTGSNITMSTSNFPKNRWVHVAWVHQNGTLSYYINGQFVNSTAAGNVSVMTVGMTSGRGYFGAYNPAYVDDVRTYNRGLSASEIQQLYNMGR